KAGWPCSSAPLRSSSLGGRRSFGAPRGQLSGPFGSRVHTIPCVVEIDEPLQRLTPAVGRDSRIPLHAVVAVDEQASRLRVASLAGERGAEQTLHLAALPVRLG